jgi:hypothetical protein
MGKSNENNGVFLVINKKIDCEPIKSPYSDSCIHCAFPGPVAFSFHPACTIDFLMRKQDGHNGDERGGGDDAKPDPHHPVPDVLEPASSRRQQGGGRSPRTSPRPSRNRKPRYPRHRKPKAHKRAHQGPPQPLMVDKEPYEEVIVLEETKDEQQQQSKRTTSKRPHQQAPQPLIIVEQEKEEEEVDEGDHDGDDEDDVDDVDDDDGNNTVESSPVDGKEEDDDGGEDDADDEGQGAGKDKGHQSGGGESRNRRALPRMQRASANSYLYGSILDREEDRVTEFKGEPIESMT